MSDEIAYRDLKAGEVIQAGDEWQGDLGNWISFHQSMEGQTAWRGRARRRYSITKLKQELALARGIAQHWEHVAEQMEAQRDEALAELARLKQSTLGARHIVDADKMVETELEQKAWELFRHSADRSTHDSFDDASRFIVERNRRRQIQRENDAIIADVVGD